MTGYGNSPPARKVASLPDSVIRFGSARICSTSSVCRSCMVAARFRSGRKIAIFIKLATENALLCNEEFADPLGVEVVLCVMPNGEYCWVLTENGMFVPKF